MPDLAVDYGFTWVRKCNCGGGPADVYKKGEYELKWRKGGYKAMLTLRGTTVYGWITAKEMNDKLKEFFPAQDEAVSAGE
ncbi:MAG: hypothetical protein H0X33_14190 [Taibaiella sp.]|nr:hypothetical protein [Taibaiella sp.]